MKKYQKYVVSKKTDDIPPFTPLQGIERELQVRNSITLFINY
jgi:hypothetical protein